ncbi:MAG: hypothetical protein JJ959_00265 [Nisaea sp.]|jgi:hypothetical protein|uniref:hypothetical protein n=1 Tax=Nisaea sp. TaxID=2024842 RepID=UPI001B27EA27|nr:hypothetical protein [Nisaea sp.]MBO6558936.1 hypothetical protein [Nisaea sp.]
MTQDRSEQGNDGRRPWRLAEFLGLVFFLLAAAAVLPMVRDSYILQDVWVAICGVIGLN